MCARRRSNFLLLRQKKVTKEKATPLSATPALRAGATCGARERGAPQNSLRAGALRSNNCGELDNEACVSFGTHATPPAALLGASRGAKGAKHPHGPLLRSAQFAQRVALAPARPGRAKQWPEWMSGSLDVRLPHPCWLRLRRGAAQGSQTGGRLFFGDFLLAKQKKVTRLPGDSRPPLSPQA